MTTAEFGDAIGNLHGTKKARHLALKGAAALLLLATSDARGQELEPRAYSQSPTGTNFALANYTHLTGDVLTDPSLPITDVNANINFATFGYARTFDLAGHPASVAVLVPFAKADVSGNVYDAPKEVERGGLGDIRLRLTTGLFGLPALSPAEFAHREPGTSVGASLSMIAPTGRYEPSRLINVGSNRWAFKPEIGISQPLGQWFIEGSLGVWLFTENPEFLGNQRRKQEPLRAFQLHGGYNFRPGLWLAADAGLYSGGATTLNGVTGDDRQQNTRFGMTLSVPLKTNWSTKFNWSKGLVTRAGGDYDAIGLTLQHLWFGP